jgi:mono/diheme cytochrome c family protein
MLRVRGPLGYLFAAVAILSIAAIAAGLAVTSVPALAPMAPPLPGFFPPALVARGATLAKLGDCAVCHTAQGGEPYAGGRPISTPFGTIFATNITPDPETGIGTWSLAAFRRALRDGIARNGKRLYPALPYTHFTHATDPDIAALYAFMMTRQPVHQPMPPNRLLFPLGWRPLLGGWDLLFLRHGVWRPDTSKSKAWNRGAYLVEAIGHCGACHTPRNALGAEREGDALAGGVAEGWYAPPLQGNSPAPLPWTVAELEAYLRTGVDARHGAAAGPMIAVTQALGTVPLSDVHAIAVYIASRMPVVSSPSGMAMAEPSSPQPPPRRMLDTKSSAIFAGACAACHGGDAPMTRNGTPSLALSTAVNAATPRDVVNIILDGLPWREGQAAPYMPGFAGVLTDADIADLAAYVRARYTTRRPWHDVAAAAQTARQEGGGG